METTQTQELEPCDYPQGWYHVYVEYAKGHKQAVVDLAKLADILPHGSGLDGNWSLQVRRNGDVCVRGEYHAMNENGFYCGWRNFRFSLVTCRRNKYKALSGPCAGKWQVTHIKGRVYLQSFCGGGDAADYLYDCIWQPLADEMHVHSMDTGVTVDSEAAAQQYGR